MHQTGNKVLILGSAPSAMAARTWPREPFTHIVAINNAWRIRPDWDYCVYPEDFPLKNHPVSVSPDQCSITAKDYVPFQNACGGFVYAGGTMAFTAGYWALMALRPVTMAFYGCDMIYPASGNTHFYGSGTADPLRQDVTLRSLEAKSARFALFAAARNCKVARLSQGESRLVFPSVTVQELDDLPLVRSNDMSRALQAEAELNYFVPSGRYWEHEDAFDPDKIDGLDQLWLSLYENSLSDSVAASRIG